VTANQVVTALEGAYGVHPGDPAAIMLRVLARWARLLACQRQRPYSAIGIVFPGQPVPVVARFFGLPGETQGRAIQTGAHGGWRSSSDLPNGSLAAHDDDQHADVFFAAMPRTFLGQDASVEGRPPQLASRTPEALKAFRRKPS